MTPDIATGPADWKMLHVSPVSLINARLQLHHAAQLANAAAMSLLVPQHDDSHTNFEWLDSAGLLAAQPVPSSEGSPVRVALRPGDLSIVVIQGQSSDELRLDSLTVEDAFHWLQAALPNRGVDAAQLTLKKHYEIPHHEVAEGGAFDATDTHALAELGAWWHDAHLALDAYARTVNDTSSIRCWPHHFDLATLAVRNTPSGEFSVGVGLSPGDEHYAEPYFYVTPYPYPSPGSLRQLPIGRWHTSGWTGAVLRGSEIVAAGDEQENMVAEFMAAAPVAAWDALRGA
jgi:hypothetical protein